MKPPSGIKSWEDLLLPGKPADYFDTILELV